MWLDLASMWAPKTGKTAVAIGKVDAPCAILLRPGDRLMILKNDKKGKERAPDWRIVVVPEQEDEPSDGKGGFE